MMFSLALGLYTGLLIAVLIGGLPWWLVRMATAAKYREGLGQRLGAVPRRLLVPSCDSSQRSGQISEKIQPTIWIHAVSVGEVAAVTELVRGLRGRSLRVVVSTTTRTGQRLARERFGVHGVFYFPLDLPWIVRRYLRALKPALLVLVETEFWPNMLAECRRSGIPVAVVNARISDRSYPRYLRLRRLWRPLLSALELVLAQSGVDVERLKAIGAPADRLRVGGNLKFDVKPGPEAPVTRALREQLPPGMRLLVCGSTVAGEEAMLLSAWSELVGQAGISQMAAGHGPPACMILAPRHPERFVAVAKLLDRSGLAWVRRSEWMRSPEPVRPGSVFLLNSVGELASVYSLASVAFVGGSLVDAGGHNPLEPAQLGVPVVMGRHYNNFRTIVRRLIEEDAIRIVAPVGSPSRPSRSSRRAAAATGDFRPGPLARHGNKVVGTYGADQTTSLRLVLGALLEDANEAKALGARGLAVFRSQSGATDRAIEALLPLISKAGIPDAQSSNSEPSRRKSAVLAATAAHAGPAKKAGT